MQSPAHQRRSIGGKLLFILLFIGCLLAAQQFTTRGHVAAQEPGKTPRPFTQPRSVPPPELAVEPVADEQPTATVHQDAALTAAPDDTQQAAELKVDDGTGELVYRQDGLIMLNRLTPAAYPTKLNSVRIAFGRAQNQPDPAGQPLTLLVYADPSGAGQLPANAQFTRIPATVGTLNSFTTFAIPDGPTIASGDFYVGYQLGTPNNGANFLVDANSANQNRTFYSTNNGASFALLPPAQGQVGANALIRAGVTTFAPGSLPTVSALAPSSATAFTKNFTLTVTGTNFVTGSVVLWNGYALPTTFVSATQLRAMVRADDLIAPGTVTVSVRKPDTSDSNKLSFTINPGTFNEAEVEENGTLTTADALPLPGARTGVVRITDPGILLDANTVLQDLFAFRITQPTAVELILQWTEPGADLDLYLLRDNDGTNRSSELADYSVWSTAATGITAERIVTGTLAPGRYVAAISNYTGSTFKGATAYRLSATIPALGLLNAASYSAVDSAAPDSIVAAFGGKLATSTQAATTVPLPTQLAGTIVKVKDSAGVERLAPLFFASQFQINFLVPTDTAPGLAEITVTSSDGTVTTDHIIVRRLAVGLFTANADGQGVPAAVIVRVKADGTQSYEPVARYDSATGKSVPIPIDLGPEGETVVLVLYGTGIRGRNSLDEVKVRFLPPVPSGTITTPAQYAGPVAGFAGLDQVNVPIPRQLLGSLIGSNHRVVVSLMHGNASSSNLVGIDLK